MKFAEKTILITGASSGIGAALVKSLAKEKTANIILSARRIELLEELVIECGLSKDRSLILQCDVSNKKEVESCYLSIKKKFGGIDVAILNAGKGQSVRAEDYNSTYANQIFGANVFGIIYWVAQLLPDFLNKKNGIIAGISSLADNRGYSGSGFYCASKAAATVYLEGLRIELKNYDIKVITVRPGFVKTPMTDKNKFKMPFLMTAEEAAEKIIRGIEKERNIVQFPWQLVFLTNLISLLPNSIFETIYPKPKY